MAKYTILCLFMLVQTYLVFGTPVKIGDIVFTSDFNSANGRAQWSKLNNAQWVKNGNTKNTCLLVSGEGMVHTSIDLSHYKGMKLRFRCLAKAEGVTNPLQTYLGVKYMLHNKSYSNNSWYQENNIFGTFNWKEIYFIVSVPNDEKNGDLFLGLQGSTGKVWFDSVSVSVIKMSAPFKINQQVDINNVTTHFRGTMTVGTFYEDDLKTLSAWNANLIRWQLTMSPADIKKFGDNLDGYDSWLNTKLINLDKALPVCKQYGIKVVIDLHSAPGGKDSTGDDNMFHDKKLNDFFISTWEKIAQRYKNSPAVWAYDLTNEPQQYKPSPKEMDYLETQVRAAEEIRKIDSLTTIIIETNGADSPITFSALSPINISNVVYETHMYLPTAFTFQGIGNNTKDIVYPGMIDGKYYDENTLKEILQPVRDFQLMYHVPIYVGEFSAVRWAPGAAKYLDDCIHIFEEYGWNWTYHAFREWQGWSVEFEDGSATGIPQKAIKDTDRKKVLLKWFAKNKKH